MKSIFDRLSWRVTEIKEEFQRYKEHFSQLKAELEQAQRAHASLEISNASLQRENEFLRDLATRSIENERYALRFQANITMQSTYGVKPYPNEPGLPENVSTPMEPGEAPQRVQGFELAELARRRFVGEIEQRTKDGRIAPELSEVLMNSYSHL